MVHGQGLQATSFPPTETIKISSGPMWSCMSLSCEKRRKVRSLSVVSSTWHSGMGCTDITSMGMVPIQNGRRKNEANCHYLVWKTSLPSQTIHSPTCSIDGRNSRKPAIIAILCKIIQPVRDISFGSRWRQNILVNTNGRLRELKPKFWWRPFVCQIMKEKDMYKLERLKKERNN